MIKITPTLVIEPIQAEAIHLAAKRLLAARQELMPNEEHPPQDAVVIEECIRVGLPFVLSSMLPKGVIRTRDLPGVVADAKKAATAQPQLSATEGN